MNGKAKIIIVSFVCGFIAAAIGAGCATRPVVVATDESVVSGQIGTARLQAANDLSRELLQYASDENRLIRDAIVEGRGGIDAALDALDRYDEFVQELIGRVRQLEYATRGGTAEKHNADETALGGDNPLPD